MSPETKRIWRIVSFSVILGLAAMSNVINSIVKCEDSAKLFKKLKERFRRTRSVEVSEQNENGGEEMIEKARKV